MVHVLEERSEEPVQAPLEWNTLAYELGLCTSVCGQAGGRPEQVAHTSALEQGAVDSQGQEPDRSVSALEADRSVSALEADRSASALEADTSVSAPEADKSASALEADKPASGWDASCWHRDSPFRY